jgi:hypothetical protein
VGDDRTWVVEYTTHHAGALSDAERESLVRAAYARPVPGPGTHLDVSLSHVSPVAPGGDSATLDAIGLAPKSKDPTTASLRSQVDGSLAGVSGVPNVHVLRAKCEGEPVFDWENALIVVDETHHQILFSTGGFGL